MKKRVTLLLLAGLLISTLGFAQSNKDLFFVFLNTNPDKEQISKKKINKLQEEHLENITRLSNEGIMRAAGPLDGGGGILILQTESIEKAKEILQTDPAIAASRFVVEVYPFTITNGILPGAEKPYDMVTYQMVRLTPNKDVEFDINKINYTNRLFMGDLDNIDHKLIVHGWLGSEMENGSVLIMDATDTQSAAYAIDRHPAVLSDELKYTITPIFIAKGTFGE